MNAFMEIQRRRLEMDAEKQAKMLELEAKKQAKMLEIEAANTKTKEKEVSLASMMTGVEIMKVDLNTMSPRKRSWFEKMQADMLKFTDKFEKMELLLYILVCIIVICGTIWEDIMDNIICWRPSPSPTHPVGTGVVGGDGRIRVLLQAATRRLGEAKKEGGMNLGPLETRRRSPA